MATVASTGSVEANGTRLFYDEMGGGQPLLFIHGMCGDASVWADQMRRLSPTFRCVAYDRRGHSRSPLGPVQQTTIQMHADDAAQLIMNLGLAPCIVVGSSGGARVAVDLIRRYPRLVTKAVLSEPPLSELDVAAGGALLAAIKPAVEAGMRRGGPRAAIDEFFEVMCPGLWRMLPEERRDRPYRANAPAFLDDIHSPPYQIARADLAEIRVPSLIIRGSESHPSLKAITSILAETIPGARLVELRGSGHVTYAERPEEFQRAVEAFTVTR